ncbi:MAG TPA: alkaline phosphatase family protein [Acidimicrobiales bacterium]|nr:alkaline phosphatase family protein [Acidimicrobiales bacterium]
MKRRLLSTRAAAAGAVAMTASVLVGVVGVGTAQAAATPRSPIQHLVVIFQENVSFDHYFGTYPVAANTSGQPFYAAKGTPAVNGLTPSLLGANPNGANPRRLDPSNINDLLTCDQDHDYTAEQQAFDGGLMDKFPEFTGTGGGTSPTGQPCQASDVMNYYDGNSVTALWNYAQHFAMSDNSFGTTFGPSAPGAINLVSGDTNGVGKAIRGAATDGDIVADGKGGSTLISDAQPYYDDCSSRDAVTMTGTNIGNELNSAGLSWGWFEGGFTPTTPYSGPGDSVVSYDPENVTGRAACGASHPIGAALGGTGQWGTKADYIPHHEPFQYYASTANPHHLAPTSLSAVGTDTASPGQFDTANHNYDVSWFNQLVSAIGNGTMPPSSLPAVSFLKAPGYEDGHAGYSDPIDEQNFVVNEINSLEALPTWSSTAVVIAYDDSDGFYDHVYSGIHNPSQTSADALTGAGQCGSGNNPLGGAQGRCGYGPRLPLLVISPWAKGNYVSHKLTDQSSIIKFIQWNWHLPKIPSSFATIAGSLNNMFNFKTGTASNSALFLNPETGQPALP